MRKNKKKSRIPVKKLKEALKKRNNFLITSHIHPDADAMGSQLAVYEFLKALGKKATILSHDPVPEHYRFIQGVGLIKRKPKKNARFDGAVILDCPNTHRIGSVKKHLDKIDFIVNIDHHISNEEYGDINIVEDDSSSTAEIIYRLFKAFGVTMSKRVVLCIYVAILTDTGSFNYSNTSSVTHEIVSDLLEYGLEPGVISNSVYENKQFSDVKLLGKVLDTLVLSSNGRIASLVCTNDMRKKTGSSVTATEDFVNYARSIKGVKVAMFLRQEEGKRNCFKVSLRSKKDISVNKIAAHFGGGGHEHAAGCFVNGSLSSVKKEVIKKTEDILRK